MATQIMSLRSDIVDLPATAVKSMDNKPEGCQTGVQVKLMNFVVQFLLKKKSDLLLNLLCFFVFTRLQNFNNVMLLLI